MQPCVRSNDCRGGGHEGCHSGNNAGGRPCTLHNWLSPSHCGTCGDTQKDNVTPRNTEGPHVKPAPHTPLQLTASDGRQEPTGMNDLYELQLAPESQKMSPNQGDHNEKNAWSTTQKINDGFAFFFIHTQWMRTAWKVCWKKIQFQWLNNQYFTFVCGYLHMWKDSERNGEVGKVRFIIAHKWLSPHCTIRIHKMWSSFWEAGVFQVLLKHAKQQSATKWWWVALGPYYVRF